MIFNIWLGGDQVNIGRVYDAIRAAKADIVLLQEPEGQTRKFAAALGWPYASERHHIISQYPLFDPPAGDADYSLAEIRPGRFVAVADIHLTSDPYGPYAVRDGKTAEEVMTIETETQAAGDRALRHRAVAAGGERRARVHRRRLQRALAPRLDGGRRGGAAAAALRAGMAGEQGARRCRLPRFLSRDASRSGGQTRHHLDLRLSGAAPRGQRGHRPHRPDLFARQFHDRRQPARRRERRTRHRYRHHALAVGPSRTGRDLQGGSGAGAGHGLARPPRRDGRRAAGGALPRRRQRGRPARRRAHRHRRRRRGAGAAADVHAQQQRHRPHGRSSCSEACC